LELPRGMKDFTRSETENIEHIRSHFKQLSNLYGFSFMDPSPIELLSTLETKSGPAIRDEIYYFKDKGDREIALRFDFTMGLTRYATSQKSMRLPAKISSFGGVFRYDEPQKGRYRYFHQWDLEIYGKSNLESESEIIELTLDCLIHYYSKISQLMLIIEILSNHTLTKFLIQKIHN